jgi:hypothetical protein
VRNINDPMYTWKCTRCGECITSDKWLASEGQCPKCGGGQFLGEALVLTPDIDPLGDDGA